jgi:hypothetical protein
MDATEPFVLDQVAREVRSSIEPSAKTPVAVN